MQTSNQHGWRLSLLTTLLVAAQASYLALQPIAAQSYDLDTSGYADGYSRGSLGDVYGDQANYYDDYARSRSGLSGSDIYDSAAPHDLDYYGNSRAGFEDEDGDSRSVIGNWLNKIIPGAGGVLDGVTGAIRNVVKGVIPGSGAVMDGIAGAANGVAEGALGSGAPPTQRPAPIKNTPASPPPPPAPTKAPAPEPAAPEPVAPPPAPVAPIVSSYSPPEPGQSAPYVQIIYQGKPGDPSQAYIAPTGPSKTECQRIARYKATIRKLKKQLKMKDKGRSHDDEDKLVDKVTRRTREEITRDEDNDRK